MISVQQTADKTRHALEGMQVQLNIVLQIVYQLVDTLAGSTPLTAERTVSSVKEYQKYFSWNKFCNNKCQYSPDWTL